MFRKVRCILVDSPCIESSNNYTELNAKCQKCASTTLDIDLTLFAWKHNLDLQPETTGHDCALLLQVIVKMRVAHTTFVSFYQGKINRPWSKFNQYSRWSECISMRNMSFLQKLFRTLEFDQFKPVKIRPIFGKSTDRKQSIQFLWWSGYISISNFRQFSRWMRYQQCGYHGFHRFTG